MSEPTRRALVAAKMGDPRALALAASAGADLAARDGSGMTILMCAARSGMPLASRCVEELLSMGADPAERCPSGDQALHWAACADEAECARLLLARGAPPADANDEGEPPLATAARMGSRACVELLWGPSPERARAMAAGRARGEAREWIGAMQEAREISLACARAASASEARRI